MNSGQRRHPPIPTRSEAVLEPRAGNTVRCRPPFPRRGRALERAASTPFRSARRPPERGALTIKVADLRVCTTALRKHHSDHLAQYRRIPISARQSREWLTEANLLSRRDAPAESADRLLGAHVSNDRRTTSISRFAGRLSAVGPRPRRRTTPCHPDRPEIHAAACQAESWSGHHPGTEQPSASEKPSRSGPILAVQKPRTPLVALRSTPRWHATARSYNSN